MSNVACESLTSNVLGEVCGEGALVGIVFLLFLLAFVLPLTASSMSSLIETLIFLPVLSLAHTFPARHQVLSTSARSFNARSSLQSFRVISSNNTMSVFLRRVLFLSKYSTVSLANNLNNMVCLPSTMSPRCLVLSSWPV